MVLAKISKQTWILSYGRWQTKIIHCRSQSHTCKIACQCSTLRQENAVSSFNTHIHTQSSNHWNEMPTWRSRKRPSCWTDAWRPTGSRLLHRYRNLRLSAFPDVTPAHAHTHTHTHTHILSALMWDTDNERTSRPSSYWNFWHVMHASVSCLKPGPGARNWKQWLKVGNVQRRQTHEPKVTADTALDKL